MGIEGLQEKLELLNGIDSRLSELHSSVEGRLASLRYEASIDGEEVRVSARPYNGQTETLEARIGNPLSTMHSYFQTYTNVLDNQTEVGSAEESSGLGRLMHGLRVIKSPSRLVSAGRRMYSQMQAASIIAHVDDGDLREYNRVLQDVDIDQLGLEMEQYAFTGNPANTEMQKVRRLFELYQQIHKNYVASANPLVSIGMGLLR